MLALCTDLLSLIEEPSPGQSLPISWYTPATLSDQRPGGVRQQKTEGDSKNLFIIVFPQLIRSFIPTLSPFVFLYIHLTGRQALLAESAMRLMLSIGRKRRSRLSSPRYTLKPSNSYWEYREHRKDWILFNPDGFLTTHSNCKLK